MIERHLALEEGMSSKSRGPVGVYIHIGLRRALTSVVTGRPNIISLQLNIDRVNLHN